MLPRSFLGALLLLCLSAVAHGSPFSTAAGGRCAPPPPARPGAPAPTFFDAPFQGPRRVGEESPIKLQNPEVRTAGGADSEAVWSVEIRHEGASYIAPHFSRFDLPPGASLVIRSPHGERTWKFAGTGKGLLGRTAGFWGIHIPGPVAVLELWASGPVPAGAVVLDRFAHGDPALPGPPEPELICGVDDTEEAKCVQSREPGIYDQARAVARLLINGVSACTGWLIGSSGHLMTNWHCIGSVTEAANTDYELMAEGPTCETDCTSWGACPGTVVATSATFIKTNSDLDYTLLQLPTNPTATYGYLSLRESGPELDERIYIAGHPAVWGKRIHDRSTSDTSGHCTVNSLTAFPCIGGTHTEVGYYCDTQGGSSGSPVLGYDDHLVVALHHCGGCLNTGVPVQPIIADLGDALPPDAVGSLCPGPGPAGLAAVAGTDRIDLSWEAVSGATSYSIYRAATAGGPARKIGTSTGTSFADEGLSCERSFVYTVRAHLDGCATPPSEPLAAGTSSCPPCTVQTLYRNDFESGGGADWTTGTLATGGNSWRGLQACTAHSGSNVFRYGGPGCADDYATNELAFAQPGGSAGIAVPAGARLTRLSFWHRRAFENGYDGGTLTLSLDGTAYSYLTDSAILGGTPFNGTVTPFCAPAGAAGRPTFTGTSSSFTETLVDLDEACDTVTGDGGGCAGESVRVGFTTVSDCSFVDDGWFLDDVQVTACIPTALPATAADFYTLTPCRVVDTRLAAGPLGGPVLQPGAERTFVAAGTCGIPATATAVALNVTVTQGASGGYVQVYPAGQGVPLTSTLNFGPAQTRSNNAIVPLALDGSGALKVRAGTGQPVHLVLDVVGYFQ